MYPIECATIWKERKVDIKASAAAFSAAAPLTFPTKCSAPLIDLNTNYVEALTTALAPELVCKHRLAEETSAAQAERVPVSYSELQT